MVKAFAESSTSVRVAWQPPPEGKRHGDIAYYKLFVVAGNRPDTEAQVIEIARPDAREYVVDELRKWTEYRVWMLAGTALMGLQSLSISYGLATYGDAARMNIVYSLRGL